MNNDIYFPARSNISFFEKKSNQQILLFKIKNSVLMHDNLIFDVQGYQLSYNEFGSFDIEIPPEGLKKHDFKVPSKPSTGFSLSAYKNNENNRHTLIPKGNEGCNYNISFIHLIKDMKLQNEEFIKFQYPRLTKQGKDILRDILWRERTQTQYIEGNQLLKNKVLENFYTSLLYSQMLSTPMLIDDLHDKLIENIIPKHLDIQDVRLEIIKRVADLLRFQIPDFSGMDVEELLDLRKDKLFVRFRNKLLEINDHILNIDLKDIDDNKIEAIFLKELIKEINEFVPSTNKLVESSLLTTIGMIPVVGPISTVGSMGKEVKTLYDFKKSWVAYIFKQKTKVD